MVEISDGYRYEDKSKFCEVQKFTLTRGIQYIWKTKLHQMVVDEFIMLKKHADYPPFIPMGLLGLGTEGSIL